MTETIIADAADATAVCINAAGTQLDGDLTLVRNPRGLVLFAHGSGSSRHSPRNRFVAQSLQRSGYATLLMDLLTQAEEESERASGEYRFNIELLSQRLATAVDWAGSQPGTRHLPLGLFGASTGAAAALVTAARRPDAVKAVVSRGGRPDLAGETLRDVHTPTLLIVGELDEPVMRVNEEALGFLPGLKRMDTVPGATHLFEEPGRMSDVAVLATEWFAEHLDGDRV